jgi:hypothetical protein
VSTNSGQAQFRLQAMVVRVVGEREPVFFYSDSTLPDRLTLGDHASWTTGNKVAVATSSKQTNKVWFTVANGITGEVYHPRHDIPKIQDLR